ncbi:MAG: winged helix-turn-helix transcriptional regulator [Sphingomonadales bacterium]|nr:winged helix-turn-helix transcriptional regulator [Sphingomonadales bacterium]
MYKQLQEVNFNAAYELCHALHHPLRLGIIRLLEQNESLTVTQIYFKLRISQSVASQQLAVLRKSRLVISHKEGKQVIYTLNQELLQQLLLAIHSLTSDKTSK